jgi:hypothetical protein
MVAGKDGSLVPPKKWARDGGTTVIAKGEQSPDGYALRTPVNETPRKVARGHAHKFTEVASLDVPASSAQAYAAGQAAEARAADPQAAIANATSGSTPTDAPVAAGQGAAEPQPRAGRSVADGKQVRHLALAKADAGRARQVKRKPSDAPNTRQASAEPTAVAAPAR